MHVGVWRFFYCNFEILLPLYTEKPKSVSTAMTVQIPKSGSRKLASHLGERWLFRRVYRNNTRRIVHHKWRFATSYWRKSDVRRKSWCYDQTVDFSCPWQFWFFWNSKGLIICVSFSSYYELLTIQFSGIMAMAKRYLLTIGMFRKFSQHRWNQWWKSLCKFIKVITIQPSGTSKHIRMNIKLSWIWEQEIWNLTPVW